MSQRSLIRLIAATVAGAALMHALASAAAATMLESTYSHRMFDVRRWPTRTTTGDVAEMTAVFLGGQLSRHPERRPTIFVGSSFAYGYPWQESVTMSSRYARLRPHELVLNISVIGASLLSLDKGILCGARNAGVTAEVAIVELPVINAAASILTEQQREVPREIVCDETIGRRGYTGFTLRHPLGVGWVPFIWDDKAYPKADEGLSLNKVPPGYYITASQFASIERAYRAQIVDAVRSAKRVADRVYVFASPVFLPGVAEVGEDAAAVRVQLDAALAICRTVAGVSCLDSQPFYDRKDVYYNMTHLNQRGHQAIAEWLAEHVDTGSTRPADQ